MSIACATALLTEGKAIQLIVDPSSLVITDVSKPALQLLGYRREDLLGRPITDIECSVADAFFWDDILQGGDANTKNVEANYLCANGELLPAIKSISCANSGGTEWVVVSAEPLPSGPALEGQLASVASLLRATLEATADGILLIDRAGKIVNMNRRFSRMWGLPDAMLVEHDDHAVFGFMAELFTDPGTYRADLAGIPLDADGETFDLLLLADGRFFIRKSLPAKHGTRILGRVFSFTDITEQKRAESARASLEAQLRESQKMEAIGTLAGGIAHDFNNIIATILGNAELARQDASTHPHILESLEEIRKAGTRARELVQQILSFSRRQPTERRLIALCPVINESVRLLRATLPARLTLEAYCEAGLPRVMADETQIEQVVINLATNAMQAMHGGPGRIDITVETVTLDPAWAEASPGLRTLLEKHPGLAVRLKVTDNGRGMDAATVSRIFEPFFTTKPVDQGTGLGLSVVHGIVQGHEGAIVVESHPAKGTTFSLYLPVPSLQDNPTVVKTPVEVPAVSTIPNIRPRILYLDDDASLVFLVVRLLERRGHRVSGYTDQREAISALRADPNSVDLLVTDYNMPGMSGLDVAREVRAIRSDLPVAVASGFVDEILRAQAEAAGVRELIFKASALEDFCDAFARLAQTVRTKSTPV